MAAGSITDQELRQELLDLGESVGPVTPTTRPLLVKKLKKLQQRKGASAKRPRNASPKKSTPVKLKAKGGRSPLRRLAGFSSDEEDGDQGARANGRRYSGGRPSYKAESGAANSSRYEAGEVLSSTRRSEDGDGNNANNDSTTTARMDGGFSDSDSSAYTGPFQRGTFRFRSFRKRKDSPDSEKKNRSSTHEHEADRDEKPLNSNHSQSQGPDVTDGARRRQPTILNTITVLLVALCVAMLFTYFFQSLPRDQISSRSASLPLCLKEVALSSNKLADCVSLDKACEIYAVYLYNNLSRRAGLFECEDEIVTSRNMSVEKLKEKIKSDNTLRTRSDRNKIFTNLVNLIINNSNWELRLYDEENTLTTNPDAVKWIDTSHVIKPILCRLKESFSKLVSRVMLAACVVASLLAFYFLVRHHWRKEEEETRTMYIFVEDIIDILRKHHGACKTDKELPPYLPIPHVRDMLIKPEKRQKLAMTWQRAVRFLSANESRIRVESQRIAGEDFEVWRWIHVTSSKHQTHKTTLLGNKKGKYWQGQAFENFQWAVNPPIISPTPCLKIRNMFDPDVELEDGWHVIIQDAILEKCTDAGSNIVHIAVDKSSSEGCVYLKCDSHDSAGVAFKGLHGCWFDGRLVAVKYLTLRRYHQRFPVALHATEPLRTSGTSPTSLVTFSPEDDLDDDQEDLNDSDVEI